jgi:tetratricopeptide (TPR) repeat protein
MAYPFTLRHTLFSLLLKVVFLLIICYSLSGSTYAQKSIKDSLKDKLQKETSDTGRVLLLTELSFAYIESNPDSCMLLALQALSLSSHIGFLKGEAASLNRIGNAFSTLGNYPRAMESFLEALKINEKINNMDGIQRNHSNIGLIYREEGDYNKALEYHLKSLAMAEKGNDRRALSIVMVNTGEDYYYLKRYDSATLFTQKAYDIASAVSYNRIVGSSLCGLGDIHSAMDHNGLALEYYRLSIPNSLMAENYLRITKAYQGMAEVFNKTGQADSSLFYAKQAIAISNKKGFAREVLKTSNFLSDHFRKVNRPDSAFFYMDMAKVANDSLFSQEKQKALQSLSFGETLREHEKILKELKDKEERKHNLQYAAIAIALITFIILLFALSRSIIVKAKFIEFFGILGLLAVFEFINLFIHPYLVHFTNDSPVMMLSILIIIGALLIPMHHELQKWVIRVMIEKNKKIRLNSALKTIKELKTKKFPK